MNDYTLWEAQDEIRRGRLRRLNQDFQNFRMGTIVELLRPVALGLNRGYGIEIEEQGFVGGVFTMTREQVENFLVMTQ
jgi:hypothetical protein